MPQGLKWMLLAGQIGMTPGRLALEGDLCAQFDRIILSFSKVLIEMLGGEASVSEDIKSDVKKQKCGDNTDDVITSWVTASSI